MRGGGVDASLVRLAFIYCVSLNDNSNMYQNCNMYRNIQEMDKKIADQTHKSILNNQKEKGDLEIELLGLDLEEKKRIMGIITGNYQIDANVSLMKAVQENNHSDLTFLVTQHINDLDQDIMDIAYNSTQDSTVHDLLDFAKKKMKDTKERKEN